MMETNKNNLVKNHERLDDLHCKGMMLIQNPTEFCFGIDAVLLSGFAEIKKNDRVLDLCTGTGVVPILLNAKFQGECFHGLEIQEDMVEMAKRSVIYNDIEDKVSIYEKDLKEFDLSHGQYNVVTVNPPYMNSGGGILNDNDGKSIARHEIKCTLEDVIATAKKALVNKGRLYMVHRPSRLVDILTLCRKYNLEPKKIRFVSPYENKEPNLVLVESILNSKAMVKISPLLVVYKEDGTYTDEIMDIYYNEGKV